MSKVPCGGFKLDENFLGMNENDELSLTGGSEGRAYQQLVTDGDGNVKWEERLAYDNSRAVVDMGDGIMYVHVSDDIGELNATDGAKLYFTLDDGSPAGNAATDTLHGVGDLLGCMYCYIALTDNVVTGPFVFPKRGIYLYKDESAFVSGVANFVPPASETDPAPKPVITWDGSVGEIKTIDPKYIPSELNEVILPSSTSGSTKKFKITVNDNGAITATQV